MLSVGGVVCPGVSGVLDDDDVEVGEESGCFGLNDIPDIGSDDQISRALGVSLDGQRTMRIRTLCVPNSPTSS